MGSAAQDVYDFDAESKSDTERPGNVITRAGNYVPMLTLLSSLSGPFPQLNARLHPKAENFVNNFSSKKKELALYLYSYFNKRVFESKLPKDMPLKWKTNLTGSAGRFVFGGSTREHILLSCKLLKSPERLRDTLLHEMCHAAVECINHCRNGNHHGTTWKTWTKAAATRFPELPRITTCHAYPKETANTLRKRGHKRSR